MSPTRRNFLKTIPLAGLAGSLGASFAAEEKAEGDDLTFGFITDIHHGTHGKDQTGRIRRFIAAANDRKPAFIIQCGDFCCAKGGIPACQGFLDAWNEFKGEKHHVIGNHDCDFQSKDDLLKAWSIPAPYYSFDKGGFHFVVLDRNHFSDNEGKIVSYDKSNWHFIHVKGGVGHLSRVGIAGKEQLEWFARDLKSTELPTIVFMHQPVVVGSNDGDWKDVASVIDLHNASKKKGQVVAALSGHDHDEGISTRHGVHYLTLTSATFGMPFGSTSYYEEDKPMFTFITLDAAKGTMTIEASESAYIEDAKMNPDLKWVSPARLAARTIQFSTHS